MTPLDFGVKGKGHRGLKCQNGFRSLSWLQFITKSFYFTYWLIITSRWPLLLLVVWFPLIIFVTIYHKVYISHIDWSYQADDRYCFWGHNFKGHGHRGLKCQNCFRLLKTIYHKVFIFFLFSIIEHFHVPIYGKFL
jgi:hypothetical protein